MNVALSELPSFTTRPGTTQQDHHASGIVIGPTVDYLERAYLDAKPHGWSLEPVVEMLIPSTLDPSLAPPGQHVASLFVQHVAPKLPGARSWSDPREKEAFADLVIATVTQACAQLRRLRSRPSGAVAARSRAALRHDRRRHLPRGLSLDQLFSLRPVMGYANYRLPLAGLYLCASGAHPAAASRECLATMPPARSSAISKAGVAALIVARRRNTEKRVTWSSVRRCRSFASSMRRRPASSTRSLGFAFDGEHRFEPGTPLYAQVSRGDCRPSSVRAPGRRHSRHIRARDRLRASTSCTRS